MSENRRSYSRFPISAPCRAEVRGEPHNVFQVDMSTNGFGIVGRGFESLQYGEAITIHIDEEVIEAVCCRANRLDDGGLHIGIHRAENWYSKKRFHKHLVKQFVDCRECEVPCEVISADRALAVIQVHTGAPFRVPKDKIKSRTSGERVESFRDENQLARFLEYYNLDTGVTISNKDNCDLINTVVDLEFGLISQPGEPAAYASWQSHPLSR